MDKLIKNEQIKIRFKDGSEIIAIVDKVNNDELKCRALTKNEVYNEGDIIFVDIYKDKIERMSILKKSKRFGYKFDKHKPQWKFNKEEEKIEKDEEAVKKVGYKKIIRKHL